MKKEYVGSKEHAIDTINGIKNILKELLELDEELFALISNDNDKFDKDIIRAELVGLNNVTWRAKI